MERGWEYWEKGNIWVLTNSYVVLTACLCLFRNLFGKKRREHWDPTPRPKLKLKKAHLEFVSTTCLLLWMDPYLFEPNRSSTYHNRPGWLCAVVPKEASLTDNTRTFKREYTDLGLLEAVKKKKKKKKFLLIANPLEPQEDQNKPEHLSLFFSLSLSPAGSAHVCQRSEHLSSLQVLRWGISFLTKADPRAQSGTPPPPFLHSQLPSTSQLSVVLPLPSSHV